MKNQKFIIPQSEIASKIYIIRGKQVMLDKDLSEFYNVKTKALNQAAKRNIDRFPEDFMFQLSDKEYNTLRSQIVTSKSNRGGRRYYPYVFTEQGIAMLSSVLKSKQAIKINIQIMRTFVVFRKLILTNKELRLLITKLEKKINKNKDDIQLLANLMHQLLEPPKKPKIKMGFLGDG